MHGLQRGDIVLFHSPGPIPMMIRSVTRSWWSHAAWVVDDEFILESTPSGGVHLSKQSEFALCDPRKCRIERVKTLTPAEVDTAVSAAERLIGLPYDWRLIRSLFILYATNKFRAVEAHEFPEGFCCSELIAVKLFDSCQFVFREDVPVHNTTPGDIDYSFFTEEVKLRNAH
jgi:cell wall-associated NlpC family hydrolase